MTTAALTPIATIDELVAGCSGLARELSRIGEGSAATYAEAAGISLRVAARAHRACAPVRRDRAAGAAVPDGLGVLASDRQARVLAAAGEGVLLHRHGADGAPYAVADLTASRRVAPDLGVDLVAGAGRALCDGPVGAALLADALGRWLWIHEASRRSWETTPEGARRIVAMLSNGRRPADLSAVIDGRVDAATLEAIQSAGWRLHPRQVG